jgi:hypothetical protein
MGFFVALELFGVTLMVDLVTASFGVIFFKNQVICMGLIMDFVSLLFSRVEAVLGFLLFSLQR